MFSINSAIIQTGPGGNRVWAGSGGLGVGSGGLGPDLGVWMSLFSSEITFRETGGLRATRLRFRGTKAVFGQTAP